MVCLKVFQFILVSALAFNLSSQEIQYVNCNKEKVDSFCMVFQKFSEIDKEWIRSTSSSPKIIFTDSLNVQALFFIENNTVEGNKCLIRRSSSKNSSDEDTLAIIYLGEVDVHLRKYHIKKGQLVEFIEYNIPYEYAEVFERSFSFFHDERYIELNFNKLIYQTTPPFYTTNFERYAVHDGDQFVFSMNGFVETLRKDQVVRRINFEFDNFFTVSEFDKKGDLECKKWIKVNPSGELEVLYNSCNPQVKVNGETLVNVDFFGNIENVDSMFESKRSGVIQNHLKRYTETGLSEEVYTSISKKGGYVEKIIRHNYPIKGLNEYYENDSYYLVNIATGEKSENCENFFPLEGYEDIFGYSKNDKSGIMNKNFGNFLPKDMLFHELGIKEEKTFIISRDGKYGVMNWNGDDIIKPQDNYLSVFQGTMYCEILGYKCRLYDKNGDKLNPEVLVNKTTPVDNFLKKDNNIARFVVLNLNDKYGVYDLKLKTWKFPPDYKFIRFYGNDKVVLQTYNLPSLHSMDGKLIFDSITHINDINDSTAIINRNSKCGIFQNNELVTPFRYDNIHKFQDSLLAHLNHKYYFISSSGELGQNEIEYYKDYSGDGYEILIFSQNNKIGVVRQEYSLQAQYDYLFGSFNLPREYHRDYFPLKVIFNKNGEIGVLNDSGEEILLKDIISR